MKPYRVFCLTLAIGFAAVGIIFGTMPDEVIAFFNNLSKPLSFPPCPETGFNFYLILAVAYMYIVTVLAVMMYRFPGSKSFPILLVNAKLASSIMSFGLFLFHSRYLVYLANFIVDGLIGVLVLVLYLKIVGSRKWESS